MQSKTVIKKNSGEILVKNCKYAESFLSRFFGLMGQDSLGIDSALWIEPCNSIHTFFMKISIDVIYIDAKGSVLKICNEVKPWQIHLPVFKSKAVLELPVGQSKKFKIGDEICLK